MIFGVESSLGSSSYEDELINSLPILKVLIKIVLEMLDFIHMLLHEVVSSDSLELEGLIKEFPSVDTTWSSDWISSLLLELSIEVHSIVVMMLIETS